MFFSSSKLLRFFFAFYRLGHDTKKIVQGKRIKKNGKIFRNFDFLGIFFKFFQVFSHLVCPIELGHTTRIIGKGKKTRNAE